VHQNVQILNPIEYPGWDELLISSQSYTFFHSAVWAKVLCETYHYRPVYFVLFDGSKFQALAPMMEVRSTFTGRRGVCLPFTDHCEFISDSGLKCQDIISAITQYGREHRWQYIELRWGDYPGEAPATSFYGHTLDLTVGDEQLFRRCADSVRTNIRKAIRVGVEVSIDRTLDGVMQYYRLHSITRRRHGLPPQPYRFFKKIYDHIISKNLGFVALAYYRGKKVAGAMFFNFGDKSMFKFGASDYTYQDLRANNLIMWEAIKWHTQHGYRSLCFGRTDVDNEGLRRFKMGWGAQERILNYYRYDLRREAFVAQTRVVGDAYHRVFRVMPIPLLRLCGSILYKHIG